MDLPLRIRRARRFLVLLLIAIGAVDCASVNQGQTGVSSIKIRGNHETSDSELREHIATQVAPKFLGIFRVSWLQYEPFEETILQKDLERIERLYQSKGFYDTHVYVARVIPHGRLVDVKIVVVEGKPVTVHKLKISGADTLPEDVASAIHDALTLAEGDIFDEDKVDQSVDAIAKALHDHGYPYGKVEPHATIDLGPRQVDLEYAVTPGISATIDSVRFEGLSGIPEDIVRRTFDVNPGEPYSADDIEDGRKAVLQLGVFSSADVAPDLSDPQRASIPITVKLIRAQTIGLKLGGGLELDSSRADIHLVAGWEHRNFLGGMRRFTLEERPTAVFFPTALPSLLPPSHVFWGNRISAQLKQLDFFEARTELDSLIEYSIYPVVLSPLNPNAQVIVGYHELHGMIGPERTWHSLFLTAGVNYNFQANFPFDYLAPPLNPDLKRIFISYVDLRTQFDLRDDPVQPHKGFLFSNSLQFTGGIFGGDANDVRLRPQVSGYVPLGDGVTVAARSTFGFLLPQNYANDDSLVRTFPDYPPVRDLQIMYFRGFFSGGADSNRGYGYREIGPHGLAIYSIADPSRAPALCAQTIGNPPMPNPAYDERLCSIATGGLTLWEASLEVRYPISGPLTGVVFADASDVSPRRLDIRFWAPHLSPGLGIRYATPVGPIRVDVGFRIPGAQWFGSTQPAGEAPPPRDIAGIPMALSLGIGEAY